VCAGGKIISCDFEPYLQMETEASDACYEWSQADELEDRAQIQVGTEMPDSL
jgi:hypothetical protein